MKTRLRVVLPLVTSVLAASMAFAWTIPDSEIIQNNKAIAGIELQLEKNLDCKLGDPSGKPHQTGVNSWNCQLSKKSPCFIAIFAYRPSLPPFGVMKHIGDGYGTSDVYGMSFSAQGVEAQILCRSDSNHTWTVGDFRRGLGTSGIIDSNLSSR